MGCLCASCCPCCKRECRRKNIGFNYLHPLRFSSFMWRVPPLLYFIYRTSIAVFAVLSFCLLIEYTCTTEHHQSSDITDSTEYIVLMYIVYSTYTVYLLISAVYVVLVFYNEKMWNRTLFSRPSPQEHIDMFKNNEPELMNNDEINCDVNGIQVLISTSLELENRVETVSVSSRDQGIVNRNNDWNSPRSHLSTPETAQSSSLKCRKMHVLHSMIGVLFQICTNMSIFNFYMFFLVTAAEPDQNQALLIFSGFAFCVSVFELCTSAIPTRLLHIIYPQIFWIVGGVTYVGMMFSAHGVAYKQNPFVVFLLFLGYFCQFFLSSIVIHFFVFGVYRLRCWILQKIYPGVMID